MLQQTTVKYINCVGIQLYLRKLEHIETDRQANMTHKYFLTMFLNS